MYRETELRSLYDRLKAQYPQYQLDFSGDCLTIARLRSRAVINCEGAKLYTGETLYDQFTSEEVNNPDDLYELIELFFLELQRSGMESGNETYRSAQKQAARGTTRLMLSMSLFLTICLVSLLITRNRWWIAPILILPFVSFVPLALIHKRAFQTHWVCPTCGEALPLDKQSRFPKMEYVFQCPCCGQILEQPSELEPVHPESTMPKKQLEPSCDLPKPGKKWPCLLAGSITAALSLFLFPLLFVSDEPLDPLGVGIAAALLLLLIGLGMVLIFCRHRELEAIRQPIVAVRERNIVTVFGMILWLLGFIMMLLSVIVSGTPPFEAVYTIVTASIGLPFMVLGIWMLSAGRSRSLLIFQDNSVLYTSSFGKQKMFAPGQITAVQLTASRSIRLLDSNGKKLVSVETNMKGIPRLAEWIECLDLAASLTHAMEKQAEQEAKAEGTVQWREEYRTRWHAHMKAVRAGKWLVLLFFAAGTLAPLPLALFADIKFRAAMAIAAIAPIPFLVFCIVFAPVLLFDDPPKNATPEWNTMHIKMPLIPSMLLALLYMGQVHYFWEGWVLQEVDDSWFSLVRILVIGVFLTVMLLVRTPKRLRLGAGFFMGLIGFCTAFGFHYYINTALCGPARHYPAVIADSHAGDPDDEEDHCTLTVIMDDGRKADLAVLREIYEQALRGEPFDLCHWESPLGAAFLDIHAPKEDDEE